MVLREGRPAGIEEGRFGGGGGLFFSKSWAGCPVEEWLVPGAPDQAELQGDAALTRHNSSLHLSSQRATGGKYWHYGGPENPSKRLRDPQF